MANAFGSITIVDMTDVGQFTTVPMSNAGIVMIYDPNALSNKYTPSSITLTPYTMYGGTVIANNDSKISYSWYKRTGGAAFDYTSPGTVTSTATSVTVASTDFSNSNKIVTYYLKAVYQYTNNTNDTVTAWGQFSVSLVEQASNIQDIEINGDHLFKYKYTTYGGNPIIDGDTSVELVATCTSNVAVHRWYYWDATAATPQYVAISSTNPPAGITVNGSTCTVSHTANIFSNNKAKFKVTAHRTDATSTELTSVYDEYEILKLYDGRIGAPGEGIVVLRLTNEDQMIPCNGQGQPTDHAFDLAFTDIEVIDGGEDVTDSWFVNCVPTGVTGSYNSTTHRYTVSGWAQDNTSEVGYVTITAQDAEQSPTQVLTKIMSLTKIKTGEDGKSPTVYTLSVTPNKVTTTYDGKLSSAVTLTANVIANSVNAQGQSVNTDVTQDTTDVIYYEWFMNGSSSDSQHGAGAAGYQFTIAGGNTVTEVVCKIRKTNQSGNLLDSQSVSFTPKGEKGQTGATGDGAISLDFPQSTDTIGLDSTGRLTSDYTITLPFTVYQGSTDLNTQAHPTTVDRTDPAYSMTINGVIPTATWGTSNIILSIDSGTQLYNADATNPTHSLNGQCVFPIDYTATNTNASGTTTNVAGTILATFTWNLDVAPENGSSVAVDTSNSWIRYKRTSNATQPTITTSDAQTIAAAQSGGTKPYYIWCCNHTAYTDGNSSEAYTVNFYPKDPVDGKSVQTSSSTAYQTHSNGTTAPTGTWSSTISEATSGKTKPYYLWTKTITSFTWNTGGSAGADAVTYSTSYYPADVFELAVQANSTIFNGTVTTITLQPIITKNHATYTIGSGDSLEWWYLVNGTLTKVTTTSTSANIYLSGNNLVIKPDAVNGGTSVQCKFTSGGKSYYQYLPIEDYTDEFRCELYSTIGDKITNGQGSGFVECILYRNGYEIDKILTGPTIPSGGGRDSQHAATINVTTEMGSSPKPSNISDINSITYAWTYKTVDSNGNLQPLSDSTYNASGKAIYIDGSMIDKKIMINCEVTVSYITV